MIWTLVLFGFTMCVLGKVAFPRIQEALDKRAHAISENIEAAERQRKEADELLDEYRERLKEAREQAEDIIERARKAAEAAKAEATERGQGEARGARRRRPPRHRGRDEALARADPPGGRRPDRPGDREGDPQVARRRRPASGSSRRPSPRSTSPPWRARRRGEASMEEIARVYADALFQVAQENGKLEVIREQLGAVRRRARREP